MSYVRSGPDSDVYVYGTKTHIEVLVAHNRGAVKPCPVHPTFADIEAYCSEDNIIPFDNSHAGERMAFSRISECLTYLETLRASGARVPEHPFERLRAEQLISDNYGEV